MSYCVNCGVELDNSANKCVLCGTKVINPSIKVDEKVVKPYPVDRKKIEVIYYRVVVLIATATLILINAVCFVINLNINIKVPWSLVVVGATLVLWTFINPYLIYPNLSSVIYVIMQTVSVSVCLFLISNITVQKDWLFSFAVPVTFSLSGHILIGIFIRRTAKLKIFGAAGLIFGMIGTFCMTVEFFLNVFLFNKISLSWSIIVGVCCISVMILFFIVSRSKIFKEEAKKRLRM